MLKNLNPRERTLAIVLGGIGFALLNFFFLPGLMNSNEVVTKKGEELQAELGAAESWVAKKDYWDAREDWLEMTEPTLNAARQDSASQLELLQEAAQTNGLKITDIQLLQLEPDEFYQPVGARLTVTGPWAGLVRFVSEFQEPTLFDVMPRFVVRSDDNPPNIRCELEIQRWFHTPPNSTQ